MTKQEKIRYDLLILHGLLKDALSGMKDLGIDYPYFKESYIPTYISRCEFIIDDNKYVHIGTGYEDWHTFDQVPIVISMIELFIWNKNIKITNKFIWFVKKVFLKYSHKEMIISSCFDMQNTKQILKRLKKNKGKMCRFNIEKIPYKND